MLKQQQQQPKLWPLWTNRGQLSFIYKILKNRKNMDAQSNHTYKTDRKNLNRATIFTHYKRCKHK